jgi:DNA-binding transcriptional LysR family regulator
MKIVNLPTELLRTFVTVIEVRNYTRAADLLSRTQPAISLQLQRLEQLTGQKLILRDGRDMTLTEQGEALATLARQILRLNDLAVSQFDPPAQGDKLRIGLPLDYAVNLLQASLTEFVKEHPSAQIEIRCDLSQNLIDAMQNDEIDLAIALFHGSDQQYLFRQWREVPSWVGAEDFDLSRFQEIPLVVHPHGCVYRERMTEALNFVNRPWRIAYSSPGIGGLQNAVRDGLGLSCLTGPTQCDGMRRLGLSDGLPNLEPLHIGLFFRQTRLGKVGHAAVDCISHTVEDALANTHA